ncbi:MAG: alpha/beta fold hydrolase [Pseudomonadota bacterium]|nr:alpha/beta fold hydrolase [Pseudomonadota bacterium]
MKVTLLLLVLALVGGVWAYTPDLDRAALEARYAGPPSQFVEVAGLRVHLRDTGPTDPGPEAAPVLILLHGFASSLHTWEDWAPALSRHCRVIRYDQPGAGLTGADPSGDYSDERAMQVLLALMDRLGVQHATLIGHSMGGRLAWKMAADHPERVDRLVLIAPDGFPTPGSEAGTGFEVPWYAGLVKQVLPRALVAQGLKAAYADPQRALTDARLTRYYDLLRAPGVRGALIERLRQLKPSDPTALLARITAPTLLLWGQEDAMIPVANGADYLRAIPQARLVTLPGAGHVVQEEAPAASLDAIQPFLEGR